MTLSSSPPAQRRSRLDDLLPRRPARKKPELPQIEGHALAGLTSSRFASRRGLLGGLTGLGFSPRPEQAPHRDPLLTLVNRITQGFNLAEYERARTMGYQAYLDEQLDHLAIDDSALDARLAGFTTLGLSPKQLYDTYSADFTEPYYQFKGAMLLRSVHSKRQLFERMCEFWNDHFSIDQNKGDIEWLFLPDNDRLVIRPNALGSFPALLSASAHGCAMLFYLDNWLNVHNAPQNNYARELLELHTLSVSGGYNEVDVNEVARCFTGWTLNPDPSSPNWLRGIFDSSLHAAGQKLVLGNVIPNFPPREDAQRVIDILVAHPSTASFLALKMLRWLLTPTPPQALVDQVASTYLATNGDIRSMLRVILARENMRWATPVLGPTLGPKFRRPFHYMVSLLRALDADVEDPLYPIFYLYGMGHVPFDHVQPNGYPDTVEAWGSSLLPRWSFASVLLGPSAVLGTPIPGVQLSYPSLANKLAFSGANDRPGLAERINQRLLGNTLTPNEVEALQEYMNAQATFGAAALFEAIALGASLPGYQWC